MIYTVENIARMGRRVRVFVNGNEVDGAVFADTEKGVVRYMPRPFRGAKGKDYIYTRKLRGSVTVEAAD